MAKNVKKFNDGAYINAATGLGIMSMDKSENISVTPYVSCDLESLASMTVKDGIADFIVNGYSEAALMKDISVVNDADGKAAKEIYKAGLIDALKEAGSNARLTGGSVIVTNYQGTNGNNISQPPTANADITGYSVYSAGNVTLDKDNFEGNEPKTIEVKLLDGTKVSVHRSRCTVIHGRKLPDVLSGVILRERYFGVSELQKVEQDIREFAAISGAICNMAQETGVMIARFSNLNQMLNKPDCGTKDLHTILSAMKLCMNSMRMTFSGKDDGFDILSHNFSGLPDVQQKKMVVISAKSRVPVSILWGVSASGLAQTNEADVKMWCQEVESWRSKTLYKPMCAMIADFTRRNMKKEFSEFNFGEVDEMTLKQILEAKKMQSETLEKYYNMGALDKDEIRESVFVNGHSWDISVEK